MPVLLRLPAWVMRGMTHLAIGMALIYIVSIVLAVWQGVGPPTTGLIRSSSLVHAAAAREHLMVHVLLLLCAAGCLASWAGVWTGHREARRDELAVGRLLDRWGLLLVLCLFVFSVSAQWSGVARPGDFSGASIGGLIAFSDAAGYFASAHDQIREGVFNNFALRRPLAAAFRSVTMIAAGFSYADMILIQAILVGFAAWWGARSVARWRGLWAGIAYFSLCFLVARTFVATALTEPLGLFWALLAIPFTIEALRRHSLAHGLVAFAFVSLALMTRMGAMFLVPAFVIWLVWQFGRGWWDKARILALSCTIVFGIGIADRLVIGMFGGGQAATGSNFSYVLCGLSVGADWTACAEQYRDELIRIGVENEQAVAQFLYARAIENLRSDPTIFLHRVAYGAAAFVATLPGTLFRGYIRVPQPFWFPQVVFVVALAIGIALAIWRRPEKGELVFWALMLAAIVASASIVFFDDGRRVMIVSYPFLWMLAATGLAMPRTAGPLRAGASMIPVKAGAAGGLAVLVSFFLVPWGAHAWNGAKDHPLAGSTIETHVHLIHGGRPVTGMLVVEDGKEPPKSVPSVTFSAFSEIIRQSNVEFYQGLLNPQAPPTPFAFIASPRVEKGAASAFLYIVPPEVLLRPDVPVWRLMLTEWQVKKWGSYWFLATKAEPVVP